MKKYLLVAAWFIIWAIGFYAAFFIINNFVYWLHIDNDIVYFLLDYSIEISLVLALVAVIFVRRKKWSPDKQLFIVESILSFYLGASLMGYGLSKLFDYQFMLSYAAWNTPLKDLTGRQLVWAFLGHNYTYELFVAIPEFLGGVLLLFNRTRFIGKVVLLPVVLNVVFVNYNFDLWDGTKFLSAQFLIILIVLFLFDYKKIAKILRVIKETVHPFSIPIAAKVAINFFTILYMSIVIYNGYQLGNSPDSLRSTHPLLSGDYQILSYKKNGAEMLAPCDTAYKNSRLFLSFANRSVLKLTNAMFEGNYEVKDSVKQIDLTFNDTMMQPIHANYNLLNDTLLNIHGIQNKDTVTLLLAKQPYHFTKENIRF